MLKQKCRSRVNIMKCMAGRDWGNSVETQRMIYIQSVRSVMEYASAGWSSWISNTTKEQLQSIQNQGLRAVYNLAKTCPEDFLHLETGIEPIKQRWEKNDDITWDRYARLPDEDPRKQLLYKKVPPPRVKTRLGWRHTTGSRMQTWDIVRETTHLPYHHGET